MSVVLVAGGLLMYYIPEKCGECRYHPRLKVGMGVRDNRTHEVA